MFEKKIRLEDNFLDYIPVRKIEWKQDEAGKVYLLKEKSKNKLLKKIIHLFNKSQHFRIHLDSLGASAWLLTDGKRSVYEISTKMKEEAEEDLPRLEQRVCFFFALLKKNKFVDFS